MRKIAKLSLLLSILLLFSSQVTAYGTGTAAKSYFTVSSEKLVSGVANVATGFVELPKNIILTTQDSGVVYGVSVGLVAGIMHTVGRTVVGALDIATFFIPTRPSVHPPFVWQDFTMETSY